MNKVITKTVIYRGNEIPVEDLKPNSQIKVTVECKHGQREIRWERRNRLCKQCSVEAGVFNTCKKGREITWGDKISKAKRGKQFTNEHKKSLIEARIQKICNKKNITRDQFKEFPTRGIQFKLRGVVMNAFKKSLLKTSIDDQDALIYDNLNYSINELKKHLESKFYKDPKTNEDMSWDNYGLKGWHIDHIKPESWFAYDSCKDSEFKECWSLNNLQPMWSWQNIDKSNKYEGEHKERKFYMLGGQFGVGKTTLCKKIKDKFNIISYDNLRIKDLDTIIANNYYDDKPILIDIPTNISTTYNRYKDKYDISLIILLEDASIVAERLRSRNGKIDMQKISNRRNRMVSLSNNYADFSGNYEDVLNYLQSLKV